LHKLWWGGCKLFTSRHGIAGTVSGVEAAIHCVDNLWISVGMEVYLRDQRSLPLATVTPTLYSNAGLSDAPLRQQSCFPHFVRVDERCRNCLSPLPTVQGTLQQRSRVRWDQGSRQHSLIALKNSSLGYFEDVQDDRVIVHPDFM